MKLTGIEIRNYRSIGNEPVILNPWKKCNILIGQNNAGKSNIIRAVEKIAGAYHNRESRSPVLVARLSRDDFHNHDQREQFGFILFLAHVQNE